MGDFQGVKIPGQQDKSVGNALMDGLKAGAEIKANRLKKDKKTAPLQDDKGRFSSDPTLSTMHETHAGDYGSDNYKTGLGNDGTMVG